MLSQALAVGAIAVALVMAVPQGADAEPVVTRAAQLTSGVETIASSGVPGPLAVFGERAFVIATGKEGRQARLPVVAGAEWGAGRVVAFGHGGMIGADALKHAGTARMVVALVRWLKGERGGPIGVVGNDAMVGLLNASGVEAVHMPEPWTDRVGDYAAIVADAHGLDAAERAALRTYITGGGGVLSAGLGWGWLQLNPGKTIHDHPGNLLLMDAGLAWCDGTLETDRPKEFAVGQAVGAAHAAKAMEALEATGDGALDAQSAATLTSAVRVVPMDHAIMRRAARLLDERRERVVASQDRPLTLKHGVERVLMALQVEIERRTVPEKIVEHPSASGFPGAVPKDAPRIEREIVIAGGVPGWHSTGLYAPPGEVITAEVIGGESSPSGAQLRIGCHTDHLWHHDKWNRVPDISRTFVFRGNEAAAASAFGGLIYVETPKRASGALRVRVRGAVAAPRFVLDQTSPAEWISERAAPGPWGELESRKVIVSVPSEVLRTLDDPSELMRFWDKISDAHATLAMIAPLPAKPHRFVADMQISAGYMHSGYPIMTHLDAADDMVSLDRLTRGSWGLLHELGHNHQEPEWTFDGTGEVTVNLFSLHAIDTICTPKPGHRGHPGVDTPPSLAKHLAKGAPFEDWKRDPFLALHMYVQLQRAFGWETFKRVFAEYRALPRDQRPKNDDERRDQWMVRFSRSCGRNLGPFFQAWGVPTSAEARASIADLPAWMPEAWPTPEK